MAKGSASDAQDVSKCILSAPKPAWRWSCRGLADSFGTCLARRPSGDGTAAPPGQWTSRQRVFHALWATIGRLRTSVHRGGRGEAGAEETPASRGNQQGGFRRGRLRCEADKAAVLQIPDRKKPKARCSRPAIWSRPLLCCHLEEIRSSILQSIAKIHRNPIAVDLGFRFTKTRWS